MQNTAKQNEPGLVTPYTTHGQEMSWSYSTMLLLLLLQLLVVVPMYSHTLYSTSNVLQSQFRFNFIFTSHTSQHNGT